VRTSALVIAVFCLTGAVHRDAAAAGRETPRSVAVECSITPGEVTLIIRPEPCRILGGDGGQRIDVPGFGHLLTPGMPMLPAREFLVALPPGTVVESIEAETAGAMALPGTYRIPPAPPPVPLPGENARGSLLETIRREWQSSANAAYSTDAPYPESVARLTSSGSLREYTYAGVTVCPLRYCALSGGLLRYEQIRIVIRLRKVSGASTRPLDARMADRSAGRRASRLFVNYDEVRDLYRSESAGARGALETYDYVIITDAALAGAVAASEFVGWKSALGCAVRTVLTTDPEITGQAGADLAQKIRNFLRSAYGPWAIQYVLLVGDYATVPMRYCYPNSTDHSHNPGNPGSPGGSVPTDYYYADLSLPDADSWDSDGDGYPGEYGEDAPDFLAEVAVGRVPTNNTARITYTLNKLVDFEQDTGPWKNQALQPGCILFYENQDHDPDMPTLDGATVLNEIETGFMSGWTVSRYSEQGGLDPSDFPWPAVSVDAFTADWRDGQYGVVNWAGHGAPYGVGRTVWEWDDGDGVPETDGSDVMSYPPLINVWCTLDDDYPSIVFAVSCNVGWPEPNGSGNLGIDLLTEPGFGASAGIVSSSRPAWISRGWPVAPGGAEAICYEFNHFAIGEGERVGDALYSGKHFCHQNYAWDHYAEHINLFNFNLYGDPSLERTGAVTAVASGGPGGGALGDLAVVNHPNPFNPATEIRYLVSADGPVRLDVLDARGRRVVVLVDEHQPAGTQAVRWDGRTKNGTDLASGVYFCRLRAGGRTETRKMVLLR